MGYQIAADSVLAVHVIFVFFVVCGLLIVGAGFFLRWPWVRNFWFRSAHLLAIAVVVVQSWLGRLCPLTEWESALRERAGQEGYQESFVGHWLGRVLYYECDSWVFVTVYTVFGALVAATWIWVPPDKPDFFSRR